MRAGQKHWTPSPQKVQPQHQPTASERELKDRNASPAFEVLATAQPVIISRSYLARWFGGR